MARFEVAQVVAVFFQGTRRQDVGPKPNSWNADAPSSVLFPPGTPVGTRRMGITATAHQLARILSSMLKTRQNHDEAKAFALTLPEKPVASNISSDRPRVEVNPSPPPSSTRSLRIQGQARFESGLIDSAGNEARNWNGIYE